RTLALPGAVALGCPRVQGWLPTWYAPGRHYSASPLARHRDHARLACLRHAASVRPEPGSNSPSELSGPEELPLRVRNFTDSTVAFPLPLCSFQGPENRRGRQTRPLRGQPPTTTPIYTNLTAPLSRNSPEPSRPHGDPKRRDKAQPT